MKDEKGKSRTIKAALSIFIFKIPMHELRLILVQVHALVSVFFFLSSLFLSYFSPTKQRLKAAISRTLKRIQ
jgi:RsiW-degrading membrane proteinase PrsW (M82 family)